MGAINQINPHETTFHGYFGPVDSNVDWCELNYVYTTYVAELFNTASSIPITLIALYGLHRCRQHVSVEFRYTLGYLIVAAVGIGSMMFHGTLRRYAQALDELPMLYAALCFIYLAIDIHADLPVLQRANHTLYLPLRTILAQWKWKVGLVCAAALQTYIYYAVPSLYALFLVSFISALVGCSIYTAYYLFYLPGKQQTQLYSNGHTTLQDDDNGGLVTEMTSIDIEQGQSFIKKSKAVPVTIADNKHRVITRNEAALAQSLYIKGALLFTLATTFWLTENIACSRLPDFAYFHAIWHLLSGTATYYLVQTNLAWRAAVHQRPHTVADGVLQYVVLKQTL